jgi:outer membrane protein assembly factor BamB
LPGEGQLAADIRPLDLTARRAHLTRQGLSRTGGWMLLAGAMVVLLAGCPSAPALTRRLPGPGELKVNWPQFRGPGGNGVASPQDPPTDWDGASGRNILWKAEVPRSGRNSPVVWGDRVFLSGGDASAREVFCWDAETGKLRWRTVVPRKAGPAATLPEVTADTGFAASTLAVNGRAVFAVFATGDLAALDLEGKILWARDLGVPDMHYGYASSLALYGDAIVVQYDQSEGGKLVAFAAADGSIRWDIPRESTSCWASPIVVDTDRGVRIFANGTPFLMAHDPAERGAVLWQLEGMMGENGSSPAYAGGRVFAANQLLCMVAADAKTGAKLWEAYQDFPDISSPLAFDDVVVMAASYGVVVCRDAASGEVLGRREFEKGFWASPILAGGRIYALDRTGVMRIIAADRTLKLLASPAIGEKSDMTPAFRGGDIFIRSERHLFCIRRKAGGNP